MDQKMIAIVKTLAKDHPKSLREVKRKTGIPLATTARKIEGLREMGWVAESGLHLTHKGRFLYRQSFDLIAELTAVSLDLEEGQGYLSDLSWEQRLRLLDEAGQMRNLNYVLNSETAAALLSNQFQTTARLVFMVEQSQWEAWENLFGELGFRSPSRGEICNVYVYRVRGLPSFGLESINGDTYPVVRPARAFLEALNRFGRASVDAIYLSQVYRYEIPFTVRGISDVDPEAFEMVARFVSNLNRDVKFSPGVQNPTSVAT